LGAARGTLITVHQADWPSYPQGDDFYTPLLQLTAFPPGTEFVVADDIDQSFLLVADVRCGKLDKPFDEKNFHIAVWYEDLRELKNRDLISGIEKASERRWRMERWKWARGDLPDDATLGYNTDDGAFVPIEQPDFNEFDDEFEDFIVPSGDRRLRVTDLGRSFLLSALRASSLNLRDTLGDRVMHLFEIGFYDTAIREACVQLEHEIRVYTRSDAWGDRLTEEFVVRLRGQKKFLESYLRTFRQEMRTVFKLIRNDFMHNLREADEVAAYAVLFRIARLRSVLKEGRV
jgi:hypothetical protein